MITVVIFTLTPIHILMSASIMLINKYPIYYRINDGEKGEGKINRQMRLYAQIGFKFCIRGSFRCIKINVSLKVDLPPKKPSIKHGSFL